ncbi:MAG: YicC family protein [Ruminococcus sp.]|nr:YicC family protein [Ruminococcus sp.]MBQ1381265.1 YicC family protein [Ruminococcus sp.]MBQ1685890.1 YicC family protein [Ruminococcus sp.]MBQ2474316.1 YicC family protein [Ruminococcus sp.]MBQ2569618.1 YicC family protein [Ruminococcus sp.]
MVKSMTGFGRCETEINGRAITVEIKSVNHRYFEFSCRITRGYSFLEDKLKAFVNARVARGKIDMFVSVGAADDVPCEVAVNHSLVSGYLAAMKEISDTYGVPNDASVVALSRFPDVFTVNKAPVDEEQLTSDVLTAADAALNSFVAMRETEGARMKADILSRAETILSIVSEIEERSPQTVREYENRLLERIRQTLENLSVEVDEQRILTEVAVFADKVAVAEETVRLRSHFEQLRAFLSLDQPVGRKIDFIIQEMNREANTIGSKVQDAVLAHKVVDIKSEIEKIREQVQNIE